MTSAWHVAEPVEEPTAKGLKAGALGPVSGLVIGVASVAPAYSLAATLFFVVVLVGFHAPVIAVLAFVPMLFTSIGYSELNKADPDCGTIFTWATRAFGPRSGWAGGWAIVAAEVLVMASLAQVAGQYLFLLFGASGIGANPTSGWVLLAGVLWIAAMTCICYWGIEISANSQKVLLSIEIVMLVVLSVVALVKVAQGHPGSVPPGTSWFNPFSLPSFKAFAGGIILMVFIYWGWDTTVAVNEETRDSHVTPGRAAILSTLVLLVTYALVITSVAAFAGIGTTGAGLANRANAGDVLSVQGIAIFGRSGAGTFFTKLLLLMVLSSAAASTQTTILPAARTTLSMAVYHALPPAFARTHPRHLTPTVSTIAMGGVSIVMYAAMNYIAGGNVITDAVTAIGLFIAFYYGLTGFACAWYHRGTLTASARHLWLRGILPVTGGLMLFFFGGWGVWEDYDVATGNSITSWTMPFPPHWRVGGAFLIALAATVAGAALWIYARLAHPPYFKGEVLARYTPALAPGPGSAPSGGAGPGGTPPPGEDPGPPLRRRREPGGCIAPTGCPRQRLRLGV